MLLEPALQQGFTLHHAEQSYLQLTRWLPSTENKLPANASHQAGICCASCWTMASHLGTQICSGSALHMWTACMQACKHKSYLCLE